VARGQTIDSIADASQGKGRKCSGSGESASESSREIAATVDSEDRREARAPRSRSAIDCRTNGNLWRRADYATHIGA
jgi:hypothetical protein